MSRNAMAERGMSSICETMRAARWHGRHDVRVEEVPVLEPQPDQAARS
jgi:hypothetical protein